MVGFTTSEGTTHTTKMNTSIHSNEPAFDAQEQPKVKFTGNQSAETTNKLWKWMGHLESPAVMILQYYEKPYNVREHIIEVLDYEMMGDIRSAGRHVVVEWFDNEEDPELAYLVFEFFTNKKAQAFSKRLRRKKHQVMIAGDDCEMLQGGASCHDGGIPISRLPSNLKAVPGQLWELISSPSPSSQTDHKTGRLP